jgi:type II secretory ATPase GspE/PulE/Tfp pilus assembly ATPase PilB-like protein
MALPNGIMLVTGPTGSGKTTTLYTGLLALNSIARKVVTIEDPIEYQLHGITQIQVKPQIGWTSPRCCARSCGRTPTSSWSARSVTWKPRRSRCRRR